jgi:hypothetical protein
MRLIVSLTPEALYFQLGSLVAEMPDLAHGLLGQKLRRASGRASLGNDRVHSRRGLVSFRLQSRAFPPRWLLGRATKLFCVLCPLRHLAQHLRAESP